MKSAIALSAILALSACTTTAPVYLADGSQGQNISCSGNLQNFGHCLSKAGEVCGTRGYDVLTREGDIAPISLAGGSFSSNQGGFFANSGAIVTRNLFIRCKS